MDDKNPLDRSIHFQSSIVLFRWPPGNAPVNSSTFFVENPVENEVFQAGKSPIIRSFLHFA
jgi:hypothetical protein